MQGKQLTYISRWRLSQLRTHRCIYLTGLVLPSHAAVNKDARGAITTIPLQVECCSSGDMYNSTQEYQEEIAIVTYCQNRRK